MSTVVREPKAEQGLPFSPGVVGSIPATPEWRQYNGLQNEELAGASVDVRCVWKLEVRGLDRHRCMRSSMESSTTSTPTRLCV